MSTTISDYVFPRLIDLHVHFREPGGEASETCATGAAAALRGGFGTVVTMPNTTPAVDSPEAVRFQIEQGRAHGVRVLPSACCTVGRAGTHVAELEKLAEAGAIAFTDDGTMVYDDGVMREVMRRAAALGLVVMDHAVVPAIAGAGVVRDSATARAFGLAVFPDEAEVAAVARDIRLCRETGCKLHIQHLSSADAVALIRAAKAEGLPVSAEATPHHLMLAAEDIPGNDANWKMNPPLGTRRDVAALRAAVLDGTIECFATDHAPHPATKKALGFASAPFGVIGLETAVGATWQAMVVEEKMPVADWLARWTTGPANILGIAPPSVDEGTVTIRAEPWRVAESDIVSKSHNSPFIGMTLGARVIATGT